MDGSLEVVSRTRRKKQKKRKRGAFLEDLIFRSGKAESWPDGF